MTDTSGPRRGRGAWLILAVAALVAIVGLALYMNRNGGGQGPVLENTTAEAATDGTLGDGSNQPVIQAGQDLQGAPGGVASGEAAKGAREAVAAVGSAAEQAAGATVEGAREAAETAETAVQRSTDGNPDSDNNEGR